MATLEELKLALRRVVPASVEKHPLSDASYSAGFDIVAQGSSSYPEFIAPQLTELLTPLLHSRLEPSVLEIGPGPKSVLGSLPITLRRKVRRYVAYEPNELFSSQLQEWFGDAKDVTACPLPGLDHPPDIRRRAFGLTSDRHGKMNSEEKCERFDVVLFCHSMYGMQPKRSFVEESLRLLSHEPGAVVIVFHRDSGLDFQGLACHRDAVFPVGAVRMANSDATLDVFAQFVAGFRLPQEHLNDDVRAKWRSICRAESQLGDASSDPLEFCSPEVMVAFNQHATKVPELLAIVPISQGGKRLKNPEARHQYPAAVVRPTDIPQVQECVKWAIKYKLNLTVIGGSHSGQCVLSNVVAVDMSAFNELNLTNDVDNDLVAVVQAGCTTGDIIRFLTPIGLTVPLGSRPSVGAGLWLQGGIGHLARLYGLACDAIIGAVLVSAASGEVEYVGSVPQECRPNGSHSHELGNSSEDDEQPWPDDQDLLWAVKGAGTNFGIVVSVVFRTYPDQLHTIMTSIQDYVGRGMFDEMDSKPQTIPDASSRDIFYFHENGKHRVGVTTFSSTDVYRDTRMFQHRTTSSSSSSKHFGTLTSSDAVDSISLFDADMYVSTMHGGHGGGKTSSFKRCVFLQSIVASEVRQALEVAVDSRPTPLCYVHFLHAGAAVSSVEPSETAFGCRDWQYAGVITGVWARDLDGTRTARDVVQWVYDLVAKLLPVSVGVYGADLGPDPRDAGLALQAFGRNRVRLGRLKHSLDPHNILPHACPLPKQFSAPELILLITGGHGVGKDCCAGWMAPVFHGKGIKASVVSISDVTKQDYAAKGELDLGRFHVDREYKEHRRPDLTAYYQRQVQQRPWLAEEHFLHVVHGAHGSDVLLITGMRDVAPVASFSHLVPGSKVIDLHVIVSDDVRKGRVGDVDTGVNHAPGKSVRSDGQSVRQYAPDLVFDNDKAGQQSTEEFARQFLLPLMTNDLERLGDMIRSVAGFPKAGVEFRHVLDIAQQPGGLSLCASSLKEQFTGSWSNIDAVVCCESGGFVFGSALAVQVDKPLVLVREGGKLPPPKVSVSKDPSHISAMRQSPPGEEGIEMNMGVVPRGGSVVLVDDVLATGRTTCAVLRLLAKAGISRVAVMAVAEFPFHRGREYLWQNGFGKVRVQSLLVFDGV